MSVRCSGLPPGVTLSRIDPSRLASRAQRLLRILNHDHSELSIKLADDAEMAALNGAWRGQARAQEQQEREKGRRCPGLRD